jgi:hypothetical protein
MCNWKAGFEFNLASGKKRLFPLGALLGTVEGTLLYRSFERKVKFCVIRRPCLLGNPICKRRIWKRATLSTGVPMENLEGVRLPGTLRDSNIWVPFSWTQSMLGARVWGQSGTSIKEQSFHHLATEYGTQRACLKA